MLKEKYINHEPFYCGVPFHTTPIRKRTRHISEKETREGEQIELLKPQILTPINKLNRHSHFPPCMKTIRAPWFS